MSNDNDQNKEIPPATPKQSERYTPKNSESSKDRDAELIKKGIPPASQKTMAFESYDPIPPHSKKK